MPCGSCPDAKADGSQDMHVLGFLSSGETNLWYGPHGSAEDLSRSTSSFPRGNLHISTQFYCLSSLCCLAFPTVIPAFWDHFP